MEFFFELQCVAFLGGLYFFLIPLFQTQMIHITVKYGKQHSKNIHTHKTKKNLFWMLKKCK